MLLSFDDEQVLMWRGKDWQPRFKDVSRAFRSAVGVTDDTNHLGSSGMRWLYSNNSPIVFTLAGTRIRDLALIPHYAKSYSSE